MSDASDAASDENTVWSDFLAEFQNSRKKEDRSDIPATQDKERKLSLFSYALIVPKAIHDKERKP